jgi:hypothetical protein
VDLDRQIRFAIPPFFLFGSLLWGAHLAGCHLSPFFNPETAKDALGLLAASAAAVVPIGFLTSALSVLVLRLIAVLAKSATYEAVLSEATLERVWGQLNLNGTRAPDKKDTLFAAATFDHELLATGIHTWILRRWNSFNVAFHSFVALCLAHVAALIFHMPQVFWWWVSTLVLGVILLVTALNAWRETMKMVEFQSYRQQRSHSANP